MSKSIPLAICALLAAATAWAQFSSGFQGTVMDRSAGVVPGVVIRVTNTETGVRREVVSSESGVYVVPSLNPGVYTIEAVKDGFVTAKQESLVLEPNLTRKMDFVLEIGDEHVIGEDLVEPQLLVLRFRLECRRPRDPDWLRHENSPDSGSLPRPSGAKAAPTAHSKMPRR